MSTLAASTFAALVLLAVAEGALAGAYVWRTRHAASAAFDARECPKVMAVLCVRGADPFLQDCLDGLLTQDYPHYTVRIVIDHRDDPAWSVVEHALRRHPSVPVEVQTLVEPQPHCSLKCASQLQALSDLDSSYRAVVLIDADAVPYASWMRELVAPLGEAGVGATTGSRWYGPMRPSWGAMTRYAWNAAATVQMYWNRIAWGGSLAISVDALERAGLRERWQHAFGEDTSLPGALQQIGLRVVLVPSLVMLNRESCDIAGFYGWARRQLISVRLHHPRWPAVLAQGALQTLVPMSALVSATVLAAHGQWQAAAWPVAGLVIYEATLVGLLVWLERNARHAVRARGEDPRWLSGTALLRYLPGIVLAQALYITALGAALLARGVEWRGIRYQILGRGSIELTEYHPFQLRGQIAPPHRSL